MSASHARGAGRGQLGIGGLGRHPSGPWHILNADTWCVTSWKNTRIFHQNRGGPQGSRPQRWTHPSSTPATAHLGPTDPVRSGVSGVSSAADASGNDCDGPDARGSRPMVSGASKFSNSSEAVGTDPWFGPP